MARRELTDIKVLNDYTLIHPALDFWADKAIISVGRAGLYSYTDNSQELKDIAIAIVSDGDSFPVHPVSLAERKLYYTKELDLPLDKWEYKDQIEFTELLKKGQAPKLSVNELYSAIKELYEFLFDFEDSRYNTFFSCFTIYTYFFPIFDAAPVVHIWGLHGTGKTKIGELLNHLCFNPVTSGNITEAGIFRLVEGRRAVCLLDESEDLSTTERGKAIINLILNGYRKGALVYRIETTENRKRLKSVGYDVYSPKVIANIAGIDKEALVSRTIRLTTSNALDREKANRRVSQVQDAAFGIRNKLYQLTLTSFSEVKQAKEDLPKTAFSGRAFEIWEGILSIAHWLGKSIWDETLALALECSSEMEAELTYETPEDMLKNTILELVEKEGNRFYSSEELWQAVRRDSSVLSITRTKDKMGKMLSRLGIKSVLARVENKTKRGVFLDLKITRDRFKRINLPPPVSG